VCNFAEGVDGKPPLLTHDDVITLFHESGHGLHHMLTQVNERDVSGISGVEWDAVELPSQFMENFCWEWGVLKYMTAHVDTGEPLPARCSTRCWRPRISRAAGTLRQIEFALFDMLLHTDHDPRADIMPLVQQVRDEGRGAASAGLQPHGAHLQPYLRGRLRGGLLQLQMGRSPQRRRLCRLRGNSG
jgi:oligopeptidase A